MAENKNIDSKYNEFVKLIDKLRNNYSRTDALNDFIIFWGYALRKFYMYKINDNKICIDILKKYGEEKIGVFEKLMIEAVRLMEKEKEITDVLGEMYSKITNIKIEPRFYVPDGLTNIMNNAVIDIEEIKRKDITSIYDHTCGSGRNFLGTARQLKDAGIDYTTKVVFEGEETDIYRACICYIQMCFYKMSARIICSDEYEADKNSIVFTTPSYMIIFPKYYKYNKEKEENIE